MSKISSLTIALALVWPQIALAQNSSSVCTVQIQEPVAHAKTGGRADVKGIATLPVGKRLWVFAHLRGLGKWWPQGGGSIQIDKETHQWQTLAVIGIAQDEGREFEITARVLDPAENRRMEQNLRDAEERGIPMPATDPACNATVVIIR